jgi:uncharacterized membrane protein
MPIRFFSKLVLAGLVLLYPLLVHWAFSRWHTIPGAILTLPPSVINAWLAWIFGRSLQAGREPMISTFARIEQAKLTNLPSANLPLDLVRYTRTLTQVWSALFIALALVSALLAYSGEATWWALFTGVVSYLLMGSLFFGEYIFRRLRFAQYRHANPFQLAWYLIKAGPIWMRHR